MEFKKILIAVDGSSVSNHAALRGMGLAKDTGAQVTFVTVSEPWSAMDMAERSREGGANPLQSYKDEATASAKEILGAAANLAQRAGVAFSVLHVTDRRPAEGILATAKSETCDLIVVGTHGRRGFDKLILGSQATEVLAGSLVPVLICK